MHVGASGLGLNNNVACVKACLMFAKALVALSSLERQLDENNAFNGCRSWAHFGIKWR